MSRHLVPIYDGELERVLHCAGLKREAVGVYARTNNNNIWEGVWLVFTEDSARVRAAPNLALFCPRASKLTIDILVRLYGRIVNYGYSKLGRPFVSEPLYSLVAEKCAEDRRSFAYDVKEEADVPAASRLICDDFIRVNRQFFNGTTTIEELRDRIASHPVSTSSGIDAMVLTYLANPNVSWDELEKYACMSENTMTKEFAMYFKTKVVEEGTHKKM